jgi:hypothetical protein
MRFFTSINLTLDCTPTIWCDNQQTVGIVTKEHNKLHTKIKHVDIHQLWIQQEVTASRINVKWVPTDVRSQAKDSEKAKVEQGEFDEELSEWEGRYHRTKPKR